MNKRQREIIADFYEQLIRCRISADTAGFTTDAASYFIKLGNSDEKLGYLFEVIYDRYSEDNEDE
ncbi:MAG: hypothetical protein LBH45_07175 [Campylobacteraceae bacterium]|jgi:hypothetical protein|nr:hypothetical protein [Campylobacteraceae bacterium]